MCINVMMWGGGGGGGLIACSAVVFSYSDWRESHDHKPLNYS